MNYPKPPEVSADADRVLLWIAQQGGEIPTRTRELVAEALDMTEIRAAECLNELAGAGYIAPFDPPLQ